MPAIGFALEKQISTNEGGTAKKLEMGSWIMV
jgi:hypothetical protein